MLHRIFAHISSETPRSASPLRVHSLLLLTLAVVFGMASIAQTDKSSPSGKVVAHSTAPNQAVLIHTASGGTQAQPPKAHPLFPGTVNFMNYQQALPFTATNACAAAVDSQGNIYTGNFGTGDVIEESPQAGGGYTSTTLFTLPAEGPCGIAIASNGTIFVANDFTGKVYQAVPSGGTYTVTSIGTGFSDPFGVAIDASGDVYVADYGAHAIFELVPVNGGGYTTNNIITSPSPVGVAVDANMNLYIADQSTPNLIIETYQGTFGSYVASNSAVMTTPGGVAVASNGAIYATDQTGYAYQIFLGFDGPGSWIRYTIASPLSEPYQIAVDSMNNVYIADYGASTVYKLSNNFGEVSVGAANNSNNTVQANFFVESGTAIGGTSVLTQGGMGMEFADTGTGTCVATGSSAGGECSVILKFMPSGPGMQSGSVTLTDPAGNALSAPAYLQGMGVAPLVNFPPGTLGQVNSFGNSSLFSVATDASGNVYSADINTGSIWKYTPSGTWSQIATGIVAPRGIVVDGGGDIYVAGGDGVYEVVPGLTGYTSSNIINTAWVYGSLTDLVGIALDANGNLYFTSYDGKTVFQALQFGGLYFAYPIATGLAGPTGVVVDSYGNVFVDDFLAGKVYKETPYAGGFTQSTVATGMNTPESITIDANNNLYVYDTGTASGSSYGTSVIYKEAYASTGYTQSVYYSSNFTQGGPEIWWGTMDASGNAYLVSDSTVMYKLDAVDAPIVDFMPSYVGYVSVDSPMNVAFANVGNAPLDILVPTSGSNPSISPNFMLNSPASACPVVTSTAATVASDSACMLSISFEPTVLGAIGGALTVTDNNLNSTSQTQTLFLNGSGIADFSVGFTVSGGTVPPVVKAGGSLTVSLTVSPLAPATATSSAVTLSATGGPVGTSYTFNPTVVPAGSGATTVVLTINIPIDYVAKNDAPAVPGQNGGTNIPVAPLALALLLLPMAGKLRNSGKRMSRMVAMLLLAIAGITATATLIGCGANKAAVYQITVYGTNGVITHSASFDITVAGR